MQLNWVEILEQIFELAIFPLIAAIAGYIISLIKAKKEEVLAKTKNETARKYVDMLEKTISDCVLSTTQTYVKALKEQNAFDEEAQKKAFQLTYDAVMLILTDEAKTYLAEATKDLETYVTNQIEARVIINNS
jgi:recombinational DNA repair ATPase RecF